MRSAAPLKKARRLAAPEAADLLGGVERRFAELAGTSHIALAVSGGPDSLAMLALVDAWRSHRDDTAPRLTVLTVDHGLRPESAAEASSVKRQVEGRGLAHVTLRWEGRRAGGGVQEAARAARYQLMLDWCGQNGASHLLVAHTRDDQAETILMRLAHGSGVDGLAGMAASTNRGAVVILRPLLDVSRAGLGRVLQGTKLVAALDPSNDDPKYERVRMRRLLPCIESAGVTTAAIARTARRMAEASAALEEVAAGIIAASCSLHAGGFVVIEPEKLAVAPREIIRRVLEKALRVVGGLDHPPRHDAVMAVADQLRGGVEIATTLAGCRLMTRRGHLFVAREWARMDQALVPIVHDRVWDGRFRVEGQHVPEAMIGPVGPAGWVDLRRALGRTIPFPAEIARTLPAVWCRGKIAAVPYLSWESTDFSLTLTLLRTELLQTARCVSRLTGEVL
ncbi:tRNA(Ile)-lysidine synthase [Rhodoligotrophos appendicifer]|uniref:tRNA lysidine(34) synthetase TilS n=1 Tax=Rhodoligotrophos appendicifer TaxID=987056 RepID=UPI001186BE81|nr:tRNA lysidine(34) synthetase TilS [Rhodoligotrophos appendicifer]